MLKIFYKKISNVQFEVTGFIKSHDVSIDDNNLTITVDISVKEGDFTKTLILPLEEYKSGVYYLTLVTNSVESFAFNVRRMFTYVHRDMENMKTFYPDILVGRVVIEENKDACLYLTALKSDLEGFENVQIDMTVDSVTSCLAKHSDTYKTQLERYRVRAAMVRDIDLYSLVLYLENQVDLLTKVILLSVPKTELNADIIQLLKRADSFSSLDIKTNELIDEEFIKNKHAVQQLQEVYLNDQKINYKAW